MSSPDVKVLLISNNPLSATGSNGRTLLGLLGDVDAANLAQFFITSEAPDCPDAGRYFRLTDREAVRLAATGRQAGNEIHPKHAGQRGTRGGRGTPPPRRARRRPLTMLARELAWAIASLHGLKRLVEFIDDFTPDIVFVQAGDSAFMLRMARNISQTQDIPLVVFNSEDYYFKRHNYLDGSALQWPIYKLWHWHFRRTLIQTFETATHIIYSCSPLEEKFRTAISRPSSTVLTPSSIEPRSLAHRPSAERFVYAGNLGLGRFRSLVELAKALAAVNPSSSLAVYGPPLGTEDAQLAATVPNIEYRGFLPYGEMIRELHEADVAVHVESFNPAIRRDTLHAFSTKIADCLASGTPLLLYAPAEVASTRYVLEHGAGIVATSPEELPEALRRTLGLSTRMETSSRAIQLAARNHDPATNAGRVARILDLAVQRDSETCQ